MILSLRFTSKFSFCPVCIFITLQSNSKRLKPVNVNPVVTAVHWKHMHVITDKVTNSLHSEPMFFLLSEPKSTIRIITRIRERVSSIITYQWHLSRAWKPACFFTSSVHTDGTNGSGCFVPLPVLLFSFWFYNVEVFSEAH